MAMGRLSKYKKQSNQQFELSLLVLKVRLSYCGFVLKPENTTLYSVIRLSSPGCRSHHEFNGGHSIAPKTTSANAASASP